MFDKNISAKDMVKSISGASTKKSNILCSDPLYFERSWVPYLDKKVGPEAEQSIYESLTFFYFWKEYFDLLVNEILNTKASLTFIKALERVYEEKNEQEKLDQLKTMLFLNRVHG